MDPFGAKEELVEVKIQISQDQKKWLERMVKEGKIAVPPGGSLSMGSVVSMYIRALLHNAMEQQQAMEEAEADEDESQAGPAPGEPSAAGRFGGEAPQTRPDALRCIWAPMRCHPPVNQTRRLEEIS